MTEKPVTHKNVHVAMAAAQAEMEPLIKGAVNPAFKDASNPAKARGTAYADLSDVVATVRGPFTRNGLRWGSFLVRHETGMDWRTEVTHGESETGITCDVPLIVNKNDMQGMKSAITYAKRIGLESVSGLAPEDDDGNGAAKAPPKDEPSPSTKAAPVVDIATRASVVIAALGQAKTMDDLRAIWKSHAATIATCEADEAPLYKDIFAAKERRKAAMMNPATDEIPY